MQTWSAPGGALPPRDGPAGVPPRHRHPAAGSRPAPRGRPASTSAGSRRTTPPTWATPRRTSPSTCSTAPGATPGHEVTFVQNVTDVDDPLLERATKVGVDWVELAERETELFREDMAALRVLPPAHYIGAVESIPLVDRADRAARGHRRGLHASRTTSTSRSPPTRRFGAVSGWDRDEMLRDLRRARRRPRAPRQEGPARLRGVARRARGRAVLGQPVRAAVAPAGTSSARRSRSSTSATPSTSRAAAATWSSRTTR